MFGKSKLKQRVRVYVENGPTIEGVLGAKTKDEFVLWAVQVITEDAREPALDVNGEARVLRERVLWYQVIA